MSRNHSKNTAMQERLNTGISLTGYSENGKSINIELKGDLIKYRRIINSVLENFAMGELDSVEGKIEIKGVENE